MADFKEKYGPWALITGASAGLGEEFARQLAAKGMNLVLAARRGDRLEALGKELAEKHGIEYRAVSCDLGSDSFLDQLRPVTDSLEVGLLINNAGFTNNGDFLDQPLEREIELVNLNCRAASIAAHHYGQKMRDRKRGGIIFSASIAGFAGIPFWASYAASKGFDLQLSEALSHELKPYNVDVLAMCPGATHTEFATYEGFIANLLAMQPEAVVSGALKKLNQGRRVWIAGLLNRINVFSSRFMPRWMTSLVFGLVVRDMVKH